MDGAASSSTLDGDATGKRAEKLDMTHTIPLKSNVVYKASVEARLRKETGLRDDQNFFAVEKELITLKEGRSWIGWLLHPTQDEAVKQYQLLISEKGYKPHQLGVFAKEVGEGGRRRFFVQTFAGFALMNAPKPMDVVASKNKNLYEIILQDKPCWLYFDLEFSKVANPDVKGYEVMEAFWKCFGEFCRDRLGYDYSGPDVIELESSSDTKFSRHVFVRKLRPVGDRDPSSLVDLVFENNAQAGLFVQMFITYAQEQRLQPGHSASRLWLQPAPSSSPNARPATDAFFVDNSVYTRNRSFRLLFQSKFEKARTLQVCRPGPAKGETPALQLLFSMASFVPDWLRCFRHALIPLGFGHDELRGTNTRVPRQCAAETGGDSLSAAAFQPAPEMPGVVHFICDEWDLVRRMNEPQVKSWPRATVVKACRVMDERYFTIVLENNRFCFCKGSSHVANSVYIVVDRQSFKFRQKCFDVDCRHFYSDWFGMDGYRMRPEAGEDAVMGGISDAALRAGFCSDAPKRPAPSGGISDEALRAGFCSDAPKRPAPWPTESPFPADFRTHDEQGAAADAAPAESPEAKRIKRMADLLCSAASEAAAETGGG